MAFLNEVANNILFILLLLHINLIGMLPRKLSLSLGERSTKKQIDQMLQEDYNRMSQSNNNQDIFVCSISKNNNVIKQYIGIVEKEYHIPNPMHSKRNVCRTGSNTKIQLSLLNTSQQKEHRNDRNGVNGGNGIKKKLMITSVANGKQTVKSNSSQFVGVDQQKHQEMLSFSDKKSLFQKQQFYNLENASHKNLDRINSKSKPKIHKQDPRTAVKQQDKRDSYNFQSSITIRKNQADDYGHSMNHLNPMSKIQKRSDRLKIIADKNQQSSKVKVSFRYCIGCEEAIIQANIKIHQRQCVQFKKVANLISIKEVLQYVKGKIRKVESNILLKNEEIDTKSVQVVRSRSNQLINLSRAKDSTSQSHDFTRGYNEIMKIGKTWSQAIEQTNKLRWFIRIAAKLQNLISQS